MYSVGPRIRALVSATKRQKKCGNSCRHCSLNNSAPKSPTFFQGAPALASVSAIFRVVFSVCYDPRGVASQTLNKVPMTELIVTHLELIVPILFLVKFTHT